MPTMQRRNALDNPAFRFWDYVSPTAPLDALPSHGFVANRWKVTNTGWLGTVSKGTSPSDAAIPKWLRSRETLTMSLTTAGTALSVKQTIEDAHAYARCMAVLTVYAFGPAGGSFEIGVAGKFKRVTTSGPDTPVRHDFPVLVQDQAASTMDVEVFRNPSGTGTYRLGFVQLTVGENTGRAGVLSYPQWDADRRSCDRFGQAIGQGITARAVSATRMVTGVYLPAPMRSAATLVSPATAVNTVKLADNAAAAAAAATITYVSGGLRGGRLIFDGFSGLTVGESYQVTTGTVGVLHADY